MRRRGSLLILQRTLRATLACPSLLGALLGALLSAGCASTPAPPGPPVELTAVPFFAGDDGLCGPAALATVLTAAGVATNPQTLSQEVMLPARGGTLQAEILAAIRRAGRLPVLLEHRFDTLLAALRAGYPVLVLQNLGTSWRPSWHYAVAVGYLPDRDRLVLRSGAATRRLTGRRLFLRSWRRADRWAAVVLEPGTLPAFVTVSAYRRAAASLESAGRAAAAERAYRAGLARWPEDRMLRLGLGNALSGLGRHEEAAASYQRLLARQPGDVVAANNFAMALAAQGCPAKALALLDETLGELAADHRWRSALEASRDELRRAAPGPSNPDCETKYGGVSTAPSFPDPLQRPPPLRGTELSEPLP